MYRAACGAALGESLTACLRLFAAHEPPLRSIAIPVLPSDEQQFPEEWACRVTLKALRAWLEARLDPLPTIVLCCQRAEQLELLEAHVPLFFGSHARAVGTL